MARALNRLTARQVSSLKEPGRHADGGGLYLRITAHGARAWVFMAQLGDKRKEIGLGPAATVSLAAARVRAGQMREALALGKDPRAVLKPVAEGVRIPTFGEFAEEYISSVEDGWRNEVHRKQWRQSLRDHAAVLKNLPISDITTDDVISVLRPIWTTKAETAMRVRRRIEKVLDAAKARKHRAADTMNPAAWRGHLALLLPAPSKLARGHHPALPWKEAPAFIAQLRAREAMAGPVP